MATELTEPCLHSLPSATRRLPRRDRLSGRSRVRFQIWSMKKDSEASTKKKPKVNAAQLRVQKGQSVPYPVRARAHTTVALPLTSLLALR